MEKAKLTYKQLKSSEVPRSDCKSPRPVNSGPGWAGAAGQALSWRMGDSKRILGGATVWTKAQR